jgi:RNA polymerase sigma factor (TIGR02999 family)
MSDHDITQLLQAWSNGDSQAFEQLVPLVDKELRRLAHAYMSRERADHTLQTTALINEAVIRLIKGDGIEWHSRVQFYAIAARRMRQILVEHAREQLAAKRGNRAKHLNLSAASHLSMEKSVELVDLDAALTELAKLDQRKSSIVEYRYFGGFTMPEIAKMLNVSTATIEREWNLARSWLLKRMQSQGNI